MSRILAYTSPARGHLFPLTAILEELLRRGHQVSLRTLSSEVAAMRSRGIDAAPIAAEIESLAHDDWRAGNPYGAVKRSVATFCERAEHEAPDLRRAIDAEAPDALLVDVASWGGQSAAEAWGGPWASFSPHPLPSPSPAAPPFGPGLSPARGPLGRLRDRLLRPALRRGFDRVAGSRLGAVRSGLGLAPFESAEELFLSAPLVLYLTAPPFEYAGGWPEKVKMVGPCTWDPADGPSQALADIEEPLVLVSTSSEFQDDGRLVEAALAALADGPYHVVATMPAARSVELDAPSDASLLEFAPHGPILERCACAITHGGMGVTQKALAHGVPVCAVPFGRDQFEVARRVELCGAGTRLPSWRLTAKRLRAMVGETVPLRPGAERVARCFVEAGEADAAASAFEQLVRPE